MILDAQLLYSDAQALTATAVSTNIVDHGSDRNIGLGEPLSVLVTIDVAAGGTAPTLAITVQADDNAGFASPAEVATSGTAYTAAQMTAGAKFVIPIPANLTTERYTRLNYTVGGTTPTVTLTATLLPTQMIQNESNYADAITIS